MKVGNVACNKIAICLPIPAEWVPLFRVEKYFGTGAVHSVTKKGGTMSGVGLSDRLSAFASGLGILPKSSLQPGAGLIEVDCGLAKYEQLYRALVWRIPKLPETPESTRDSRCYNFIPRIANQ